jgi:hypothetical protein
MILDHDLKLGKAQGLLRRNHGPESVGRVISHRFSRKRLVLRERV